MPFNRLCEVVSTRAATIASSTTVRKTKPGIFDISEQGTDDTGDYEFGWGVRDADGNYIPALYEDFLRATVVGVSFEIDGGGAPTVYPDEGDIVNLLHPVLNRIVLRWRTTGNPRISTSGIGSINAVGFPVELVEGSYSPTYGSLPVDTTGSIRVGQGLTETNRGERVTRKVWARIRDTISSAGLVVDAGDPQEARTEEALAVVRFYPEGVVGLSLMDDLQRDWLISGSQVVEDRTAIVHDLTRVVTLGELNE